MGKLELLFLCQKLVLGDANQQGIGFPRSVLSGLFRLQPRCFLVNQRPNPVGVFPCAGNFFVFLDGIHREAVFLQYGRASQPGGLVIGILGQCLIDGLQFSAQGVLIGCRKFLEAGLKAGGFTFRDIERAGQGIPVMLLAGRGRPLQLRQDAIGDFFLVHQLSLLDAKLIRLKNNFAVLAQRLRGLPGAKQKGDRAAFPLQGIARKQDVTRLGPQRQFAVDTNQPGPIR